MFSSAGALGGLHLTGVAIKVCENKMQICEVSAAGVGGESTANKLAFLCAPTTQLLSVHEVCQALTPGCIHTHV